MTDASEIPSPKTENDLSPNPCSLFPNPCSLVPDPCLLKTDAPAASSGFSYDPYLPSPETANSESPTSFYLPSAAPRLRELATSVMILPVDA